MTTIDTTELRKFAEAATPGPWRTDPRRPRYIYTEHDIEIDEADWGQPEGNGARVMLLTLAEDRRAWRYADVKFVAAANPAVVLALLDDVDRIRRQWADERRVYIPLAEDVRLVDVQDGDEPDDDVDYGEVWSRIGRRLDAIAKFEAGEDPTEADTEDETRLPL